MTPDLLALAQVRELVSELGGIVEQQQQVIKRLLAKLEALELEVGHLRRPPPEPLALPKGSRIH